MPHLRTQKDFKLVRNLPFCYLCGRDFVPTDTVNWDHVPPKSAFSARDREPPLKLKTHQATCHDKLSDHDKKVGQLISLRRGEGPKSQRDQALQFFQQGDMVGLNNPNIELAVWRWIKAFHAALYQQPLTATRPLSVQTPFPRGRSTPSGIVIDPILQQHIIAVEIIKRNRVAGNLDTVISNNQKLRYECVWRKADSEDAWACFFALDIYDWKDLGSHSATIPARGCVGIYMLPSKTAPDGAAFDEGLLIEVLNTDKLDAFAR
jgi:hypothetical protein